MFGGREDFPFGHGDVFLPAGDDEDGFFPTNGGLDVRVRLGPQRFDFATCRKETQVSLARCPSVESHKKSAYFKRVGELEETMG